MAQEAACGRGLDAPIHPQQGTTWSPGLTEVTPSSGFPAATHSSPMTLEVSLWRALTSLTVNLAPSLTEQDFSSGDNAPITLPNACLEPNHHENHPSEPLYRMVVDVPKLHLHNQAYNEER